MTDEGYTPNFVLTRDLLDNRLLPSDYDGEETEKYFVDGFPEVLVRHNAETTVESMRRARDTYLRLGEYGISLLNYAVVPHKGEAFVIGPKVHGKDLLEAIEDGSVPSEEADHLWKNVLEYHAHAYERKIPIAVDLIGSYQYVFGHLANEQEKKIYLVDLSMNSGSLVPTTLMYCNSLILLCQSIVESEEASGEKLAGARTQLEKALISLPPDYEYGSALRRMVNAILTEKNLDLDFEDDRDDFV